MNPQTNSIQVAKVPNSLIKVQRARQRFLKGYRLAQGQKHTHEDFTGKKAGTLITRNENWQHIPAELRRRYRACKAGAKPQAKLADNQRHFKPLIPSVKQEWPFRTEQQEQLVHLYRDMVNPTHNEMLMWTCSKSQQRHKNVQAIRYIKYCGCNPEHVSVKIVLCHQDPKLLFIRLWIIPQRTTGQLTFCMPTWQTHTVTPLPPLGKQEVTECWFCHNYWPGKRR